MSELKWGIEITVPSKVKGRSKEALYSDETGTLIFPTRSKATKFKDEWGAFPHTEEVSPNPRVVRVKVTVSKVKPKL